MGRESVRIGRLRDWFEKMVQAGVDGVGRNGSVARRLPGNSSLRFDGVDAEALIANLQQVALSTGSACTSGALEPSHVLTAIGLSRDQAYSTIRVGIGRFSIEYWRRQPTAVIVASLVSGAREPLRVKADGTVMDGNTRVKVLEERGYDLDTLPYEPYPCCRFTPGPEQLQDLGGNWVRER